jgi:hydrogenase/urease accessory protein HupE
VALVEQVLLLSLPTIGLLIATRRPGNPLGWLFLLAGLGLSAFGFASGEQHPVPWTDSWSIRSCRCG